MSVNLKPCPFCGGSAHAPYSGGYTSCASRYPSKCPLVDIDKAIPVDVWNTRSQPAPQPDVDDVVWPGPTVVETKKATVVKVEKSPPFVFDDGPQPDAGVVNAAEIIRDLNNHGAGHNASIAEIETVIEAYAAQRSAQDCTEVWALVDELEVIVKALVTWDFRNNRQHFIKNANVALARVDAKRRAR